MRIGAAKLKKQRGQAVVEYLLITLVVMVTMIFVFGRLRESEFFFKNITSPVVQYLRYNYKYGDPTALGWDEAGGPRRHIQIYEPNPDQNFRLFVPTR